MKSCWILLENCRIYPNLHLFFITLATTSCFACHNFQPLHQSNSVNVQGVSTATNPAPSLDYHSMDKCLFSFPPYNAEEIVASTLLNPLSDELTVTAGGRLTCGFDDPREYCSWHNAMNANTNFSKAQWNALFDMNRFECTHPRNFPLTGSFLLVKGDLLDQTQTAALETTVPCQFDPGTIKFDIWSNSDTTGLRYCVTWANSTEYCENAVPAPNPLSFTVPHSADPVNIRIEVTNINAQDVVLIDNLYYEGRICELIDEDESTGATVEDPASLPVEPQLFGIHKIIRDAFDGGAQPDLGIPPVIVNAASGSDTEQPQLVITQEGTAVVDQSQNELEGTDERVADLMACEELACDFNHNHSCFYKLNGFGSTSSWQVGSRFVGNRHTGVQRLNPHDTDRVGYAYVGRDHVDDSKEIFVMESPKFEISSDARLTFDVYLRSYSPKLRVCIDSFDDCSYHSPPISKNAFWHSNHAVNLAKGVRKVYFIATGVRQNQFLAVDRIRVIFLDGKSCI